MRQIDSNCERAGSSSGVGFRLSPQQRRLWRLAGGQSGCYQSRCLVRIDGMLDTARLHQALVALSRRHELLRTRVRKPSGSVAPLQFVDEAELSWQEWSIPDGRGDGARSASLEAALAGDPWATNERLTLAASLGRASANEHWLVLRMPAILADRATLRRVVAELAAAYAGDLANDASVPQYADIAEWQCQVVDESGVTMRTEASPPSPAPNPTSIASPTEPFQPRRYRYAMPAATQIALASAGQACGRSTQAVVLACLELLLWKRCGSTPTEVGIGCHGRPYEELRGALGPLARHVGLGLSLEPAWSFRELVERVADRLEDMALGQEYLSPEVPAEHLAEGETAIFRFGFEAVDRVPPLQAGRIVFHVEQELICNDRFGIHCTCYSSPEPIALEWLYDPGQYSPQDVARLAAQHAGLVERAIQQLEVRIAAIGTACETEQHWLLRELNDTSFEPGRAATVMAHFAATVRRTPDRIALSAGEHQLSYRGLAAATRAQAQRLRRVGVGPEVVVAISAPRSCELVLGILAVLESDGICLPLDADLPPLRRSAIIADSKAAVLLSCDRQSPLEASSSVRWLRIGHGAAVTETSACVDSLASRQPSAADLRAAYVIYTSGSTGHPKGVVVSHRALANYIDWCRRNYPVGAEAVPLHTSIGVDLTLTSIFLPLAIGRRIEVIGNSGLAEHLAAHSRTLSDFGLVKLTPTHLAILQASLPSNARARGTTWVVGGEPLGFEQVRIFTGQGLVVNEYGPTEATVGCCVYEVPDDAPASGAVPIGRSIDNTRAYVLDRALRPVGVGVQGELYLGGDGLARGYLGRPAWTAERFVPDPFAEAEGGIAYRTGDLAYFTADGQLVFVGRADRQVKVRGHRVELDEVEQALRMLPGVRAAAVRLSRESQSQAEDLGDSLLGYVVLAEPTTAALDALHRGLAAKLPPYMLPDLLVPLENLPVTRAGKIDYAALPSSARGAPASMPIHAPIGEIERGLAEVWSQVLGRSCHDRHASFFELGGDSIRALIVLARARDRRLIFSLEQLFERRTLARLAQVVELDDPARHTAVPSTPLQLIGAADRAKLPPDVEDAYPVAQLQAGIIYHCELNPQSNSYHDVATMLIRAPFDFAALESAIETLCLRHAILRTTFDLTNFSVPLQLVHRESARAWAFEDLSQLSTRDQQRAVTSWIAHARRQRFRWSELPLLQFQIHRRGDDTFQVSTRSPSALLDGWSLYSMLTEFGQRYDAATSGQARALTTPAPRALYRDFVAAEQAALHSEAAQAYWSQLLADHSGTNIPLWPEPNGNGDGTRHGEHRHEFSADLSARLVQLSHQLEVPLKSVLLAAHVTVLAHRTGKSDVLTGLIANGRLDTPESDRVLGVFLNTIPFRARIDQSSSVASLIQTMTELELEALPHRRYPLGAMVGRNGRTIPFESVFEFTHFHVLDSLRDIRSFEVLDFSAHAAQTFVWWASVNHSERENRLTLTLDHHALCDAQARAICNDYEQVLTRFVSAPFSPLNLGQGISREQNHLRLCEWNDTARGFDLRESLVDFLLRRGRAEPDRVALVEGDSHVTFGALDARSDRVAGELRSRGVGDEDAVVVCLERGTHALETFIGVWKAGAYYVPLDPDYPASRNQYVIDDVRARAVIERKAGVPTLSVSEPRMASTLSGAVFSGAEASAYCIYTSGSTGTPKGVSIPRRALVNLIQAMTCLLKPTPEDVVGWSTTACFDIAALEMYVTLAAGSRMVIVPSALTKDGLGLRRLLEQREVTIVQGTPSLWRLLLESGWSGAGRVRALCGGEAVSANLAATLATRSSEAWNLYGPTETTIWSTAARILPEDTSVTIGRPIANTQTYVLDARLAPSAVGVRGELYIGGSGVARGYVGLAAETAARFVPDPFAEQPGARLFRTGDGVRQHADGRVEFLGRRDSQIKIRGFRVALEEIESALARHEAIADCRAAIHQPTGGERQIAVYFVPRARQPVAPDTLRDYLRQSLPEYMVPAYLVPLEALPLLPNGKVNRAALPVPRKPAPVAPSASSAATTALQRVLARLWCEVLAVPQLGIHDDFFSLGGDSLSATRIVLRVREMFGLEVPLQSLFEVASVAGLADALRTTPGAEQRDPELIAEVLLEVADMSEEEARAQLAEPLSEHEELAQ